MNPSRSSHRAVSLLLVFLLLPFLTGCWSSHEIEERGITSGLALDLGNPSPNEKKLSKRGGEYPKRNLITITYQFINPQQSTGTVSKGAGPKQKSYINVSETGDSVHQLTREIALRKDNPAFSPHLKVIVVSGELLRNYNLKQLLDQLNRDNEIRPSTLVLISHGRARKTLENKGTENPAFRLFGIVGNEYRTTRIIPPVQLIKLQGKMESGTSFLLQNVIAANEEVKLAGAAIIKGKTKKLAGYLNEKDVEGFTWLTGKGKGGVLKSHDPSTGELLVYEITSMKSRIIPHAAGKNISFDVKIRSEGMISEKWAISEKTFSNAFLKRAEETFKKEVRLLVKSVVVKMQNEYQADAAGFGNRLRIEYPRIWNQVKRLGRNLQRGTDQIRHSINRYILRGCRKVNRSSTSTV